ncbi:MULTISPECIES: ferritin-like domain-containing protein [unclassified Rhodococcus (in: high G+C Gram-positive bacteria)]|uniref:ferritin-like domain-containing protein n=1 Tax=unclassified Rhodococcus (in: high G+C Gram-positive bacteria) TaxID=192944 RepID=UPI00163B4EAF|nr:MULTISPECIES: ferritin-like domain-containing protein [unclassified Rhodococcus (in: high G+C Gram-positive bacteria)]MBC2640806.1 ferritin-like domain-containing protein [Rhodococcus sp. 3A]MBC2894449.1 ferritin-like domain-containing protein [Rhodococcus sp. 4CII]
MIDNTATLITQLRVVLDLTHNEIQVAETRIAQARTEAVRRELSQNAGHARQRADAVEEAIRDLGGLPDIVRPWFGRATAMVKTMAEQAQPFDEALLGDLVLEHQLLERARYLRALATASMQTNIVDLAGRLITAHTATVEWLTMVLAEDALGGPAALRRTPLQAATGTAIRLINVPAAWSARGLDRAIDTARATPDRIGVLLSRGAHAGNVATKTLAASRDAARESAEEVTRREGAAGVADAIRNARNVNGSLEADELPISGYDELNVSGAVAAVKELTVPADIRTIIAHEEANKNRHGVVSAAQTRLAAIAQEVVGIG